MGFALPVLCFSMAAFPFQTSSNWIAQAKRRADELHDTFYLCDALCLMR
jgi:hypothetical protein